MKCVAERISGGGPPWAHEAGRRAPGGGRALHPRGQMVGPPGVFSVPDILKYSTKKLYFIFGMFGEFYFRGIFYYKDNSKNR